MFGKSEFDHENQIFPIIYDLKVQGNLAKVRDLISSGNVRVADFLESQVIDLIKSQHAGKQLSDQEISKLLIDFFEIHPKESYGNWIFYPWSNVLVHVLPEEEFIQVRTSRNNYKITKAEQEELRTKKVGIVGLSVGQSVALAIAMERSCGEIRLADFDTLELSNLNRIRAGLPDLGIEKTIIAAREIAELDPYLKLTIYRKGVDATTIDDFLTKDGRLDLVIDECDSLDIKILIRERARGFQIPVMMETSDRGMLDIERFDIEHERPIFHGFVGDVDYASLRDLTTKQKVPMVLKITGVDTLSARMKVSLLEINQSLTSWPQLASAVFLGGASVGHVARKFLLGENVVSGRYYVDLDQIIPTKAIESKQVKISTSPSIDHLDLKVPENVEASLYQLSKQELVKIVKSANLAPSGGNSQPWIWVFDKKGVLHLFQNKSLSKTLLDYKSTGSLLAFGAALENIRLASAEMGVAVEITYTINQFEEDYIAQIRFVSKSKEKILVPYGELSSGIALRCTNRKNGPKQVLSEEKLNDLKNIGIASDVFVEELSQQKDLVKLASVIGAMDRYRLLHDQGYEDFMNEIRWSHEEAKTSGDGIDIATLELDKSARAAMGLVRDSETVKFFRKYDLGYGLASISDETVLSSSAVLMLETEDYSPAAILNAGVALQRIWLKANMIGISVQPIAASLFLFQRVEKEVDTGFTLEETASIRDLKAELNSLFNKEKKREEIFMIRLNVADEPSMRAYRRDIWDSLRVY